MIYCKESSGKGRGVFSNRLFLPGDLIEAAPVIVIPESQRGLIGATILDSCAFEWGAGGVELAIVLGHGSLYNHSTSPNAHFYKDIANLRINFVCITEINPDEEIFINYNGNGRDSTPIVFEGYNWKNVVE